MARKAEQLDPLEGLIVFTGPDDKKLFQAPDGAVFDDPEQAQEYRKQNRVEMTVNMFMSHVEANLADFIGGKDGKLPEKESALNAQKTRMRKAANNVLTWYFANNP